MMAQNTSENTFQFKGRTHGDIEYALPLQHQYDGLFLKETKKNVENDANRTDPDLWNEINLIVSRNRVPINDS